MTAHGEKWAKMFVKMFLEIGRGCILSIAQNIESSIIIQICIALMCSTHSTQHKKATIHQVTTMLTTSKNVLFEGHKNLLTTGTDGPTLWL